MKKHIRKVLNNTEYIKVLCHLTNGTEGFGTLKKFPEAMVIISKSEKGKPVIPAPDSFVFGSKNGYNPSNYQLNFSEVSEGKCYICRIISIDGRKIYAEAVLESKDSHQKEYNFDQDEIDFIGDEFSIDKNLLKLYCKAFNLKLHATMQAVFLQTNCNHWMLQFKNDRPALFHENRTRYGISGSGSNGSYHKQFVCEAESIEDYLQYIIMHDFSYKPKNNLKRYSQTKLMYA